MFSNSIRWNIRWKTAQFHLFFYVFNQNQWKKKWKAVFYA